MSTQTETFTAGEVKRFDIPGGYFKLFDTTSAVKVRFYKGGQPLKADGLGVQAGFGLKQEFDSFSVESPAAQTVTWFVSDGVIDYDRTVGEVSVIDGGEKRARDGTAFHGYVGAGGVGGEYAYGQIWNPDDSGLNVFLERVVANAGTAGLVGVLRYNTRLTDSSKTADPKNCNGAATVIQLNYGHSASWFGTIAHYIGCPVVNASVPWEYREPLMIPPGFGLHLAHATTGAGNNPYFEFFTKPV